MALSWHEKVMAGLDSRAGITVEAKVHKCSHFFEKLLAHWFFYSLIYLWFGNQKGNITRHMRCCSRMGWPKHPGWQWR